MPAGFSYPEARDLWVPLEYDEVFRVTNRGAWYLQVIGRLKPGVSADGRVGRRGRHRRAAGQSSSRDRTPTCP